MAPDASWPGGLAPPLAPGDTHGPVFREPWEAQAFALVVALHQAGHFSPNGWQ